jgi:hypothetical protein
MAGQGAGYIDKIIHGAKPADLLVQQPAKLAAAPRRPGRLKNSTTLASL